MDIQMPGINDMLGVNSTPSINGIEATRRILRSSPEHRHYRRDDVRR